MIRPYKLPESSKEGIPARFGGWEIPVVFPDIGTDENDELVLVGPAAGTVRNILVAAGGDAEDPSDAHENAWSIFVAGGYALAVQKHIKKVAAGIEPTVSDENARQALVDAATSVPKVTVREKSGGAKRESAKAKGRAEAVEAMKAKADEAAKTLTPEEAALFEAMRAKLGL